MFTDDPTTPLRLETLLSVLRELRGEATRETLEALMEPPGLPDLTSGTKGVKATIRAALELALVSEADQIKLLVRARDSFRAAVLEAIDAKVLSGVDVEPYFARFYAFILSTGQGDMGMRKQGDWASAFRERCTAMGFLDNPFNPTKLTGLLRWYRYCGLGWHDPTGAFQCCPTDRLRRRLPHIFGELDQMGGDSFVDAVGRACPELDGGAIYREVNPGFDSERRELGAGVGQALLELHEEGDIRLHGAPDSRGWSIAAASPPRDGTLRSERIDSVEWVRAGAGRTS